jgi:beta-glucanase (GH16 family)
MGAFRKYLLAALLYFIMAPVAAQVMQLDYSELNKVADAVRKTSFLRLEIVTSGKADPLIVKQVVLFRGKGLKKRDSVKWFYTAGDSILKNPVASGSVRMEKKLVEHTLEQELKEGKNFFWIELPSGIQVTTGLSCFDLGRQQFELVWSDEFNGDRIDTANWSFEKGFVRNEELQWYQTENASQSNGLLTIEARREKKSNPAYTPGHTGWRQKREFTEYTSSSMRTAGKQSWMYGRFELRARIDTVLGYWPAWWTLGVTKRWPSNGEIDIMEYYTGKILANYAVGTATPNKAYWFSNTFPVNKFGKGWKDSFHVWRMDWDEEGISIFLDDVLLNYESQANLFNRDSSGFFPFKQNHYMLLNLAIGGQNGGDPSGTLFPLKYEVDYVRVRQKTKGMYRDVGRFVPARHETVWTKPLSPGKK